MVCNEALPDGLSKEMSAIILLVNIVLPGVGTIVAGSIAPVRKRETIYIGIAQLITAFIIIGWIWAVVWSVFLFQKAEVSHPPLATAEAPAAGGPQQPPSQEHPSYGGADAPLLA